MSKKIVYVPHPEAHNASEEQTAEAFKQAGVSGEYQLLGYVNVSGAGTEYTVEVEEAKEAKPVKAVAPGK